MKFMTKNVCFLIGKIGRVNTTAQALPFYKGNSVNHKTGKSYLISLYLQFILTKKTN